MDLSNPITLRLPVDILQKTETIAAASERSRSGVIVRALRHYLAAEGADILKAMEGQRQLDAGESETLDAVIEDIESIVRGDAA